ncbi:TonB-system energizer ExbB [Helicobacter monodelphidis]|uniref:TonB-system energizer ExbB n=1 Tax=Helicobacter sp. 15-1451 TaxID=2004995 RepID=UPI000DCF4A99|nr:TonB-system energizer ExbB [Helicobacter sp. 15-1451]RAX58430.1 TonB-system energizer ExbB [Helicobacter sp. 15-1451]
MEFLKEYIDYIIFAILGLMSFCACWFSIERAYFLSRYDIEKCNSKEELEVALTNNLSILYIIYSNAPYVGLLGTVIGIMIVFYDMGQAGGLETQAIMIGLSLALKATALGLFVAIPTLMIYHALMRRVNVLLHLYQAGKTS